MWANPITFNLSGTNGVAVEGVSSTPVTITFGKGTNTSNAPTWYDNGSALRFYSGNTITIASSAEKITKIELTNTESQLVGGDNGANYPSNGTYSVSNKVETWTATDAVESISISITNKPRLTKIVVYLEESNLDDSDFALTGVPVALTFDLYNNASAQTISYTTSSTGAVTVSESEYVETEVNTTNKTITVTPKKKTSGAQEITVSQAADESYKAGSATFTVTITDSTPKTGGWVKTDITDLTADDVFVIVGKNSNGTYAMSNDKGTSAAPTAVAVTIEDDEITGEVADNIKWNISSRINDVNTFYTLYPNENNEKWLYCTNTNDGVRVGINSNKDNKEFRISEDGYLWFSGLTRFVGIYNSQDWRCYSSINNNIKNQTFAFYKYVDNATVKAPVITVDATFISSTTASITCATDGATIYYSFDGENWTEYTNALNITETTTIYAKAVLGSDESTVVSKTTTRQLATPTVTIDATGITNTNVYEGTAAGSLSATVTYNEAAVEGATVTWSGNNDEVATINETTGAVTLVAAGKVTFTATFAGNADYNEATATYELTVTNSDPNGPGTVNNPYTVAEAIAYINTLGSSASPNDVYVSGIISKVDSYNSTYKSITYWISDDGTTTGQMQVYSGKGLNGADFSAKEDLAVGDIVTVKGKVKEYNSTPEFDMNNELVSLERPITPTITVNPVTVNATADETQGTINVTYNNVYPNVGVGAEWYTDATCTTTTTVPSWIEIGYDTSNNVNYSIAENTGEARTAYMKIWSYSAPEAIVYSELITFTQAAPVVPTYATLPFSFDSGKAAIENTDGLYQEGLGSDYSSSPKLKFDGTGDWLLLQFSERPGTLTFDVKGNSFSDGTFKVQTSEDGISFTDLETYADLSSTQNEEFNNLGENVRYIKWIYTEKVNGNVALGNIALAKYTAPVIVPSITVEPATVNALATDTEGTLAITCENLTISDMSDFGVMFFDEHNQELTGPSVPGWIQVLVAEQDPSIGEGYVVSYTMNENTTDEARTAYFEILAPVDAYNYVYSNRVTVTQAASVAPVVTIGKFVKVTSTDEITSGQYLIVYEDESVAFDGSLETLDASENTIDLTIENGKIAATTTNAKSVFNIDVTAGTLQSASGLYIGVSSNSNGLKTSNDATTYTHTFSINEGENAVIAAIFSGSTMSLMYNSDSGQKRFRYYKNSGQKSIQLYKFVPDAEDVEVTVSAAGYATYCSTSDLDFSATGLTAYKATITDAEVKFTEVKQVPAGQGVLLKGAQGTYSVPVAANAAALTGNAFIGVTEQKTIDEIGIFVLMNGDKGVGFYKTTKAFTVGAHTAYLPAMGAEARSFIGFDFDGGTTTTIAHVEDGELKMEDSVYNLQGQRVVKAQKGLYIVNGRLQVVK